LDVSIVPLTHAHLADMQVHTRKRKSKRQELQTEKGVDRYQILKVKLQRIFIVIIVWLQLECARFLTSIFYSAVEKKVLKKISTMNVLHNVALFNCYYCIVNKRLAFSFLRGSTREEHSMGWTIMAQSTTAITSAINSTTVCFPFPKFNDKLDGVSNDGTGVPEKKNCFSTPESCRAKDTGNLD
jgi:hypothetical protein